jgi:hypothetical protein
MLNDNEEKQLKEEIDQCGPKGTARRYPKELREKITRWVKVQREKGVRTEVIASTLGVSWESLARWAGERGPSSQGDRPRLRAVRVTPSPLESTEGRLTVRTPQGFAVEGLDMAGVIELMRRLG